MLKTLYKRLRPHGITILISIILIVVALLLFWAAQVSKKTIWDYSASLIVPIVVGIVAFWYQRMAKKRDSEIEADRQNQVTLATYFDRMSELLLKEKLRDSGENDEVRIIARARTLSAIRNLDGKRVAQLIRFLTESGLGGKKLLRIELAKIDLQRADLRKADLEGATLEKANLQGAILVEANLEGATLKETNLQGSNLELANLRRADLWKANLEEAYLWETNLQGADLEWANLRGADLWKANLEEAKLEWADLRGAKLILARGVGAIETLGALLDAYTRMPNGMKFGEWVAGKLDWAEEKAETKATKRQMRTKSAGTDKS